MISFCIKTNNKFDIETLPLYIGKIDLSNVVFVTKKFSKYTNIIVHYLGNNKFLFYKNFANVLCNYILDNYEQQIINKIISYNFFYFDSSETDEIEKICSKSLPEDRQKKLFKNIFDYLENYKSMVLKGFLTFRIFDYIAQINSSIDSAVSQYVINREYSEFIELIKLYISSEPPCVEVIHLLYSRNSSTLLDSNQKIISSCKNNLDIPYLSDISFSENDYTLNSLLNLLPKKLIIHTEKDSVDDFINTLKSIFDKRAIILYDYSLAKSKSLHT